MEIKINEKELIQITNNVINEITRNVNNYFHEQQECENQRGVYYIEKIDLTEYILDSKITLETLLIKQDK